VLVIFATLSLLSRFYLSFKLWVFLPLSAEQNAAIKQNVAPKSTVMT